MEDNKRNSHKIFKLFILLLLIGVLFFINKDNQMKFIQAYKSLTIREKSMEKIGAINLSQSNNKIGLYEENIALWGNDKLSIIDINNNPIMEKEFNFENPDAVFRENRIYVMDKSSGDIYIINSNGDTLERLDLDNNIYNLFVDEDNIMVHTKSEVQENLVLLNTDGVFLRIHPLEDRNILTYDIDKKREKYLISNLNIRDNLESEINVYSINGDPIDQVSISDEIIIFTKFIDEDLITLTDKCLYYIRDSKIYWKKSFTDIKNVVLNNNLIYVLYGPNLEVVDLEGRTVEKFYLSIEYNKIRDFDKYILLIGDNNLLGIQGNKEILEYKHEANINDIIVNKNYLGIVDNSKMHLFKVNNK
ncbi:MAG: DUF5711 family protein [Tissierellaceae bacterium]|nr:DUF5711 family protein [Tissierellaceae bacterium]